MKSTALPQAEVKGSTSTKNVLTSVGLRVRQQCQLLALEFFVKRKSFQKEETKNGDCYKCRIKDFLKCLFFKRHSFCVSVHYNAANRR